MHIKFIKDFSHDDYLNRGAVSFDKGEIYEVKPYHGSDPDFSISIHKDDSNITRKIDITRDVFKYLLRKEIIKLYD